MKIFVSHSHQDTGAAKALIDMLLSNITLDDKEIRCTSVPNHTLRFGKSISQLLKEDINVAPAILALISQKSLQSNWVMFELGAAWGLGKNIYPVVGPGINIQDLPGPLGSLPCIVIESQDAASRLAELIKQVSEDCNLEIKTGGKAQASLNEFIRQYIAGPIDMSGGIGKKSAENQEDEILLAIWKMDESEYDQYGYSVGQISEKTNIAIPKCEHILSGFIKKNYVEKRQVHGPKHNGDYYRFKDAGRTYLIDNDMT